MPKSSLGPAISLTVSPRRYWPRSGRTLTAGGSSLTAIGAGTTGNWPEFGSLCGPLRNGMKSTAVEPSADGAPLTGFSGYGGLDVGGAAGPLLGGSAGPLGSPLARGVAPRRHKPPPLFFALYGVVPAPG